MSKAIWETLKSRINIAYYLGAEDFDKLNNFIEGDSTTVEIGIDVDNDGVVDKKVSLKKGK
jgi:hypothetical protein